MKPGLPHPASACVFGFSQPLDAFIRPVPAGLVSCRIRSWGFPSEPCSSRAAVRRLRRRCPLALVLLRPCVPILGCKHPQRSAHAASSPGLQGLAPPASPPSPTGGLDQPKTRSSLGLLPSRVFSLTGSTGPSSSLPSRAFRRQRPKTMPCAAPQGLASGEVGSSLARLPTLLGFATS
jgi:hypothetical protein